MTRLSLTVFLASLLSASPKPVSVCEAVRSGEKLEGREVLISGIWRTSFPGASIFDELADDRCPESTIHVVATGNGLSHPPPKYYRFDSSSASHANAIAQKALADGRELSVVILGVLYFQRKSDYVAARPLNDRVAVPAPEKWYPAVLLIESVPHVKMR